MTETAVTLVINKLFQLLVQEASLLSSVHREIVGIRDELESIKCFLKDAEARTEKGDIHDGLKTWVKQVREAAYHIEDVIDEYVLHIAQQRHEEGFAAFLHKIGSLLKKLKPNHEIATKIQDIKILVREIKERSERYRFNSSEQSSRSGATNVTWHDPRVGSLFIEDDEVVGIESTRDEFISWLVGRASRRSVISVVGMGRIGKTTLAKKVYENDSVKGHFDCRVWITVSQSYNMQKILMTMTKQVYQAKERAQGEIYLMEETMLISQLREYLHQKKYVVVLDDVWKTEFWEVVKHALPCNNRGSRIVITTRSDHIGASCKESSSDQVHRLQPLSQEKAWELFSRKAFHSELQGCCPRELVRLSLDIVRRCEGLPLALVAIGGLLSTKEKIPLEWQKLHNSLSSELESNPHLTSITKILTLSYHDLPYYLKSCFLYFSIFPEDYSITDSRLFRLWIAEGYIKGKKGKTLEEVGEENLIELIHRNLVQVSLGENDYEVCKKYRIHDLLHEIILSKAGELNFCQILEADDLSFIGKSRCLSIHGGRENVLETIEYSQARSIFLFNINELTRSFMVKLFKKLRLLKVLDFQDAPIACLPEEVGNLFHLKYLSLRNTKVKLLPKSVGRLQNLQTLNILDTPTQTLVEANHQEVGLIKEAGKVEAIEDVGSISEDEILDLQSLSSPPQYLEQLIIRGQLEKFPNWIPELQNLVTLGLYFSGLMEDPLKCIQALPNLINLFLNQGYGGEQLHFKEDSFRKLKKLTLRNLVRLKMVKIERRALPLLEQLEIGPCLQLKEVPSGIQLLKNLQTLDFSEICREFALSMQPDGGQDYWKVKNITTVRFKYRIKGEQYQMYKLGVSDLLERLRE
uniref:Disease resistance protein RPM1-like n=1 Tax=Fagus sylvatica TaxID=28930 RepID=A0A2N9FJ26_FAGSY